MIQWLLVVGTLAFAFPAAWWAYRCPSRSRDRRLSFAFLIATSLTQLCYYSPAMFPFRWHDLQGDVLWAVTGLLLIPTFYFGWKDWLPIPHRSLSSPIGSVGERSRQSSIDLIHDTPFPVSCLSGCRF